MIGYYNYTVILTYLSMLSGVLGILLASDGQPTAAIICLMVSGLCDMFDGQVARTRKRTDSEKKFGIQIDSLSDLICFGVLPSMIGYSIGMRAWYCFIPLFLFPLTALIRLAYFNVTEEERQAKTKEKRKSYEGLPVTNAALIFPFIYCFRTITGEYFTLIYTAVLLIVSFAFVIRFKVVKIGLKGLLLVTVVGSILLFLYLEDFSFMKVLHN